MAKPTGLEIPSPLSLAIPVRNSLSGFASFIFYLKHFQKMIPRKSKASELQ